MIQQDIFQIKGRVRMSFLAAEREAETKTTKKLDRDDFPPLLPHLLQHLAVKSIVVGIALCNPLQQVQ